MGQRSTGSVTLYFGLISIPVKLYLTASAESVSFKMITADGNFVKQSMNDAVTGIPIDRDTLQKGYEYTKGQLVIFTQKEVNDLASSKCNTATIEEFVPYSTIDPIEIETTKYMAPEKGADKSYALLVASLKKKKAAAVAKLFSHGREHLVVIVTRDNGLIMHQMFYKTEVRTFENTCAKVSLTKQELELAGQMIELSMVNSYGNVSGNPELYRDNYIDRVNLAVQEKLNTGKVTLSPVNTATNNGNLLDMLQASVTTKTEQKKKRSKVS